MAGDFREEAQGDAKAAFDALVNREMSALLEAARHEVAYYEDVGDFPPGYMSPEELVGAAMIRAWERRKKRPEGMQPRTWLYLQLFRTADALAGRRRNIQKHETLSSDQVIPDDPLVLDPLYDDDEEFYEWFQPDEALKWEDVIPSTAIAPEELLSVCESEPGRLNALERRAAVLYFRLGFSFAQVCAATGKKPEELAGILENARARLRE